MALLSDIDTGLYLVVRKGLQRLFHYMITKRTDGKNTRPVSICKLLIFRHLQELTSLYQ